MLLTLEGELLQQYARESLQHWESFHKSLLEGTRELHGEISLYCSVTASYSFLFDVLTRFRRQHPKIRIKLHTGDPEQATARVLAGEAGDCDLPGCESGRGRQTYSSRTCVDDTLCRLVQLLAPRRNPHHAVAAPCDE